MQRAGAAGLSPAGDDSGCGDRYENDFWNSVFFITRFSSGNGKASSNNWREV